MSTQAVQPAHANPKPKTLLAKPAADVMDAMKHSAAQALKGNVTYAAALTFYRGALIHAALRECKGVKKHAAARLGISRVSLDDYLKREKEML